MNTTWRNFIHEAGGTSLLDNTLRVRSVKSAIFSAIESRFVKSNPRPSLCVLFTEVLNCHRRILNLWVLIFE